MIKVYLPTFMFVIVSWVSFLIKPEVVPGRSGARAGYDTNTKLYQVL